MILTRPTFRVLQQCLAHGHCHARTERIRRRNGERVKIATGARVSVLEALREAGYVTLATEERATPRGVANRPGVVRIKRETVTIASITGAGRAAVDAARCDYDTWARLTALKSAVRGEK